MALAMPRPVTLAKSGMYHLNVRVPVDLVEKMRKSRVKLPLDDELVTIAVADKVTFSLRTKDPVLAKVRFTSAYAALSRHFDNLRAGPQPLTHKQAVALAGDIYRCRVDRLESDPSLIPEWAQKAICEMDAIVASWRFGSGEDDDDFEIPLETAKFFAAIQRPSGPQMLAWETQADVDTAYVKMPLDEALAHLFGADADALCAERSLHIDAASRKLLLREIGKAVHDAANKLARNLEGDYAPDPAATRFPAFKPMASSGVVQTPPRHRDNIGVGDLFDRWIAANREHKAASTLRRYGPSLSSLAKFVAGLDVRELTDEHIWAWAEHRRDVDGIAAKTVNRNDLVAASSVLAWAMTRDGSKLRADNPAAGVRLREPKIQTPRPPTFFAHEVAAILRAARAANPDPRYPRASASRRWTAWICAYTGGRIQEVCWLSKEDIWCEGGIWILRFTRSKNGHARLVPIHDELQREGLLDFWQAAPSGSLFVGDRVQKEGSKRSQQEQRASELAEWVREQATLPADVSPNHGWRHTFITRAEAAGIPKRFSNAITGHNQKDASDGYITPSVDQLGAEMMKFPRYELELKPVLA